MGSFDHASAWFWPQDIFAVGDNMIQSILKNPDVIAALVFCASALTGQVFHAVKKWAEGYDWIMGSPRRTVGAVIGNLGGMIVFIQTGVLGPLMAMPNGMFAIFLFGFMNGFTSDSALNASAKKIWSEAERAEHEAAKP